MNIKGLFEYDSLKLAKDNLEAELLMAKITATELTKQNDDLNAKILAQDKEIESLTRENEALKKRLQSKVALYRALYQSRFNILVGSNRRNNTRYYEKLSGYFS